MTMQDTRIVLRTGGEADPIVDHPGQPADYVQTDGNVWTWRQRWRIVGGIATETGWSAAIICAFMTS